MKLLELLIALALSAMLWLIIDTVYSGLWRTRTHLEQSHEALATRQLPQQLFGHVLYHAGNLGCRAVSDGVAIKAPAHIPDSFFIHQGKALRLFNNELWVHETLSHQIILHETVGTHTVLSPPQFEALSDWLLVSDCLSAELVPYGGTPMQTYQAPVFVTPILIYRWYLKNETLYRQQVYPALPAQPVFSPLKAWHWEKGEALMRLTWDKDVFVFETRNSSCY